MHRSVATIDSPEFLNLQPLDINPLMSKCDIKVLYVGENRNQTALSQPVVKEISKTLRGAPIVGYYKKDKEDFADHGEKIIIDDEGVHFEKMTIPYGFVSPDAKVWFQNFEDTDENGNVVIHKYLMTTGYLWTGQFPESSLPVEQGRPQSMELEKSSLQGHWEKNYETGLDFFIITDAVFSKICILGDDVEPCFEGASVTAPNVSNSFTLDDNFKHTMYSMMQDLRKALEGGQQMENLENSELQENAEVETSKVEYTENTEVVETETEEVITENTEIDEDSAPADYVEKDKKEEENSSDEDSSEDKEEEDEEEKKNKYTLLEQELSELKDAYQQLYHKCDELQQFKDKIEEQKKDALINEFYMLSDEDKADVIKNKAEYTLDEIKSKLSVICFDKKINLSDNETDKKEENTIVFTLEEDNNSLPDWVKAVKEQEKLG